MTRGGMSGARAVLLGGPVALAFFTGGYFDEPRAWAGLVAWLLVVVAALALPRALPRGRTALIALGGLAALAAWTLASIAWAPIAGSAYHAGQIVVLYLGVLLAATMLLRERRWQRTVEPALAAGALIVIGYGISERLLPGVLHFSRSITAEGRLEQPLTYWNAMGELAALGFVRGAGGGHGRGRRRAVAALNAGRRRTSAAAAAGAMARRRRHLRRARGCDRGWRQGALRRGPRRGRIASDLGAKQPLRVLARGLEGVRARAAPRGWV